VLGADLEADNLSRVESADGVSEEPRQQVGIDGKLLFKSAHSDWNECAAAKQFDRHATFGRDQTRRALPAPDDLSAQTSCKFGCIHDRAQFA
jgi:hypothetical protein